MPAADAAAAPPAGIRPLQVNNKQMTTYELKTGPGRKDTVPHKFFRKDEMLAEVAKLGFYSAWNDVKKEVEAYAGDELLLVADGPELYGENFYLCLTEEAKAAYFYAANADQRAEEEAAAREEAEEERRREEEAALEMIVVKEEARAPRPYVSPTATVTEYEVRTEGCSPLAAAARVSRPAIVVRLQRRRKGFAAPLVLADRDTPALIADVRPRKDPNYELKRRVVNMQVQAGTPGGPAGRSEHWAQTDYNPLRDFALQADLDAEPAVLDADAAQLAGAGVAFALERAHATARIVAAAATLEHCGSGGGGEGSFLGVGGGAKGSGSGLLQGAFASPLEEEAPVPEGGTPELLALLAETVLSAAALEGLAPIPLPTSSAGAAVVGGGSKGGSLPRGASSSAAGGSGGGVEGLRRSSTGGGGTAAPLRTVGSGASSSIAAAEALAAFCRGALALTEHALAQNETLNVYTLSSSMQGGDGAEMEDAGGSGESSSATALVLREERQFSDLELSLHRVVPSVAWHPSLPSWVAVAAVPRFAFDQLMSRSGVPRWSHVLLYTLGEFTAQVALEVPGDATVLAWCPTNVAWVAVGLTTGQVALFDLTDAHAAMRARKTAHLLPGDTGGSGKRTTIKATTVPMAIGTLPPSLSTSVPRVGKLPPGTTLESSNDTLAIGRAFRVLPRALSHLDSSHTRPVTVLTWLPLSAHLNHRNRFVASAADGSIVNPLEGAQFISASTDGMVAVWDTKALLPKVLASSKTSSSSSSPPPPPSLLHSTLVPCAAEAGILAPAHELTWAPQYSFNVRVGAQPLGITAASLDMSKPSNPLIVTSMSGVLAAVDWAPSGEGTAHDVWLRMASGETGDVGAVAPPGDGVASAVANGASRILWISAPISVPEAVVLARHPSLPDTFLVVMRGSWGIWRVGSHTPLISSSPCAPGATYTSGAWSPSRPAVFFLGRFDGSLEAWDIMNSLSTPTATPLTLVSAPITALVFRGGVVSGTTKQLMAVGDGNGSLHVVDVPFGLRVPSGGEGGMVTSLLDREASRVKYLTARAAVHSDALIKRTAAKQANAAAEEAKRLQLDAELRSLRSALSETDPAAAASLTVATVAQRKQDAARAAAEQRYAALQASIMAEMGIKDVDIINPPPSTLRGADDFLPPEVVGVTAGAGAMRSPSPPSGGAANSAAATVGGGAGSAVSRPPLPRKQQLPGTVPGSAVPPTRGVPVKRVFIPPAPQAALARGTPGAK